MFLKDTKQNVFIRNFGLDVLLVAKYLYNWNLQQDILWYCFLQNRNSILYILQIVFICIDWEKINNARWDKLIRNVYRQWFSKCLLWEVWLASPSRMLFIFSVKDLRMKNMIIYKSIYIYRYIILQIHVRCAMMKSVKPDGSAVKPIKYIHICTKSLYFCLPHSYPFANLFISYRQSLYSPWPNY